MHIMADYRKLLSTRRMVYVVAAASVTTYVAWLVIGFVRTNGSTEARHGILSVNEEPASWPCPAVSLIPAWPHTLPLPSLFLVIRYCTQSLYSLATLVRRLSTVVASTHTIIYSVCDSPDATVRAVEATTFVTLPKGTSLVEVLMSHYIRYIDVYLSGKIHHTFVLSADMLSTRLDIDEMAMQSLLGMVTFAGDASQYVMMEGGGCPLACWFSSSQSEQLYHFIFREETIPKAFGLYAAGDTPFWVSTSALQRRTLSFWQRVCAVVSGEVTSLDVTSNVPQHVISSDGSGAARWMTQMMGAAFGHPIWPKDNRRDPAATLSSLCSLYVIRCHNQQVVAGALPPVDDSYSFEQCVSAAREVYDKCGGNSLVTANDLNNVALYPHDVPAAASSNEPLPPDGLPCDDATSLFYFMKVEHVFLPSTFDIIPDMVSDCKTVSQCALRCLVMSPHCHAFSHAEGRCVLKRMPSVRGDNNPPTLPRDYGLTTKDVEKPCHFAMATTESLLYQRIIAVVSPSPSSPSTLYIKKQWGCRCDFNAEEATEWANYIEPTDPRVAYRKRTVDSKINSVDEIAVCVLTTPRLSSRVHSFLSVWPALRHSKSFYLWSDDYFEVVGASPKVIIVPQQSIQFQGKPVPKLSTRILLSLERTMEAIFTSKDALPKWLFFGDDDTLIFEQNLRHLLNNYDPRGFTVLSGVSECRERLVTGRLDAGMFAYGGGGVVMTLPLAQLLYMFLPTCLASSDYEIQHTHVYPNGDQALSRCYSLVENFLQVGIRYITHPGFHQMDFVGSNRGYFDSIFSLSRWPIISIHKFERRAYEASSYEVASQYVMALLQNVPQHLLFRHLSWEHVISQDRDVPFFVLSIGMSIRVFINRGSAPLGGEQTAWCKDLTNGYNRYQNTERRQSCIDYDVDIIPVVDTCSYLRYSFDGITEERLDDRENATVTYVQRYVLEPSGRLDFNRVMVYSPSETQLHKPRPCALEELRVLPLSVIQGGAPKLITVRLDKVATDDSTLSLLPTEDDERPLLDRPTTNSFLEFRGFHCDDCGVATVGSVRKDDMGNDSIVATVNLRYRDID